MLKEQDIAYENGRVWIHADKRQRAYVVYVAGITHSTSDSAYEFTDDGLSIAKARADYLASPRYAKARADYLARRIAEKR